MSNKEDKPNILSKLFSGFKKNNLNRKFKNAGEGHRLCDDTRQPILNVKPQYIPPIRTEFSECAVRAGEAALIRDYEKKRGFVAKPNITSNSSKVLMTNAKEELEKAYELRDRALGKAVEVDNPKQLNQVYFCCPGLFDFDIIGGYHEMEEKIWSYLESEKEENPLLASCLIIPSKCKNPDLLASCVGVIETLITNIIKSPTEMKFRKIRLANDKIKQNIVQVDGAVDFLKAVGFVMEEQLKPGSTNELEPCLVMNDESCDPEKLTEYLGKLKEAEPLKPTLYRDTNVYHKSNLVNITEEDLPSDFFRISLDELKRQNYIRKQQIEESGMLLTKAMRENMKVRDKRKYRYVLIRIAFPNNWILQGTFASHNRLADIQAWITDCLKVNSTFFLSVPPIIRKITDFEQTIVDAELAPCSTIRLTFDDNNLNDCHDKDANPYLKDHLCT